MPPTKPIHLRLSFAHLKLVDALARKLGFDNRTDVIRLAIVRMAEEEEARTAKLKADIVHGPHKL
jgi:Arc/MetJ-type ribon-helix-helix transcriptional regulator